MTMTKRVDCGHLMKTLEAKKQLYGGMYSRIRLKRNHMCFLITTSYCLPAPVS